MTVAPSALPICTAARPTPPAAPRITRLWPAASGRPRRERVISAKVRDQKGGAFGEGKSRRKSDDLIHGHDGLFGIAAGLHADDDMLAGLECIDVRRRVGDKSGRFLTDDEGKRGTVLILALDHQQVGE